MLGYKYLWVDRLSIDQSHPDEQMYLISRMDAIYKGAEFTIINAARDAQAGRLGVEAADEEARRAALIRATHGRRVNGTTQIRRPNHGVDLRRHRSLCLGWESAAHDFEEGGCREGPVGEDWQTYAEHGGACYGQIQNFTRYDS
ncbi:hypothetical protein HD806DRAFT_216798 [Xylariaceae sp. AK1471]|nr:hypothetical protein HD806DRAFT_216798 [Xylariaceae sp. AK1471]